MMSKSTVAAKDKDSALSEFNYEVHFTDGALEDNVVTGYTYSTVFDKLVEKYENDQREVSQIVIDLIR